MLVTLLIGACGPATSSAPSTAQTARQPDQGSQPLPLSERGPYSPGRIYTIQDPQRQNRQVRFTVWYPAKLPRGDTTPVPQDAKTNKKGAPYPLILCAAKDGRIFAPHLVSHGFVVAGVEGIDTYERWDRNLIDQPLDILFMLRQIGGELLEGLKGMIDAERAGAMGYSFDGYNALALSGVRVDPQFYLDCCAHVQDMEPPLGTWQIYYLCEMAPE